MAAHITGSGESFGLPKREDGPGDVRTPEIWDLLMTRARKHIAGETFDKWMTDLRFLSERNHEVVIVAPSPMTRDRVRENSLRLIQRLWGELDPKNRKITIAAWEEIDPDMRALVGDPWAESGSAVDAVDAAAASTASGSVAQTFETLEVGASNARAVSLAKRIAGGAKVPAPLAFLYGRQGVGKTHILRALQSEALSRDPDAKVVYMTAEQFLSDYVEGVRQGDTSGLKTALRSASIVLIDDLQALASKEKTEAEFFATVRAITQKGGRVVLTADEAPGDLKGISVRLRAELRAAIHVEVELPDDDMRLRIVKQHAAALARQYNGQKVSDALARRIVAEVRGPGRELCGVLGNLYLEADLGERAPTAAMLEQVIRRAEGERKPPSIDTVKRAAMRVFGVSKADLASKSRAKKVTYPRQIAMYLSRELTEKSFPQIGTQFGGRDHTTVLYAHRKLSQAQPSDEALARDIEEVRNAIRDIQLERGH